MSSLTDQVSAVKKPAGVGKRLWLCVTIVMIFLTPWVFYRDLKEAYKTGKEQETKGNSKTIPARLQTAVEAQLAVLHGVDFEALGFTYFATLQATECNWLFQCHPIQVVEPPNPFSVHALDRDLLEKGEELALAPIQPAPRISLPPGVKLHDMKGSVEPSSSKSPDLLSPLLDGGRQAAPVPEESEADRVQRQTIARVEGPATNPIAIQAPELPHVAAHARLPKRISPATPGIETVTVAPATFTRIGPIRLPTLHAIRGTPYAFWQMVIAIHDAGFWATTMYLSCTLIWIMLWLRKMPWMLYLLVFGGPLSVSLMVTLMQWLCEELLKLGLVGCAIAAGLMMLAPSTALALAVGLNHVFKSPRELFEALEHLKK